MIRDNKIWFAQGNENVYLIPRMANRHGLIAGATGTGKTITMKVLAESFSALGVPVFLCDVKGDVSGICEKGTDSESMQKRIEKFGLEGWNYAGYPTHFWDIFGEGGHPIRVTVSQMGPVLLSQLLGLTDVQSGVMDIVFKVADDNGLLLLDLKDLKAMLRFVGDNREEFTVTYGNVTTASIGAIQRALLRFEDEGGDVFFGEPSIDIQDWLKTDYEGRGYINVLSSERLIQSPKTYSLFLFWMMTELFEKLPEVGDLDKPRMVFFFDEAHLLFDDAPKALVQKIEQVCKLIRSKGVGVYFVTQNPTDIPNAVLAQLSNRIQHALRAYTPAEQKSVRAAASAFRENPAFKTETAITELGVGEALVSCLDEGGIPGIVERARILPPQSKMAPADSIVRNALIVNSEFENKYREIVDRESAYEILEQANAELAAQLEAEKAAELEAKEAAKAEKQAAKEAAAAEKAAQKKQAAKVNVAKKATTAATSTVATAVSRNLVNSLTGGKKTSGSTIAKRAATNALSSVVRSGTNSLIRGIFGNLK